MPIQRGIVSHSESIYMIRYVFGLHILLRMTLPWIPSHYAFYNYVAFSYQACNYSLIFVKCTHCKCSNIRYFFFVFHYSFLIQFMWGTLLRNYVHNWSALQISKMKIQYRYLTFGAVQSKLWTYQTICKFSSSYKLVSRYILWFQERCSILRPTWALKLSNQQLEVCFVICL